MNEFTLNSAEKYKNGEPIMTDTPVQLVRLTKRVATLEKKIRDDEIGQYTAHSLKEYFDDEMTEEMKAIADEYIKHEERILKLENLCNQLHDMIIQLSKETRSKLYEISNIQFGHFGENFCGNCVHHKVEDEILPYCELTGDICDHDDASCAMYQDSYVNTDSFSGKPDREECKHCPKSQCDNCMNFPF